VFLTSHTSAWVQMWEQYTPKDECPASFMLPCTARMWDAMSRLTQKSGWRSCRYETGSDRQLWDPLSISYESSRVLYLQLHAVLVSIVFFTPWRKCVSRDPFSARNESASSYSHCSVMCRRGRGFQSTQLHQTRSQSASSSAGAPHRATFSKTENINLHIGLLNILC
jgi:hypothetical protein